MSRYQRILNATKTRLAGAAAMGIGRLRTEDEYLEGAILTIDGRKVVDFGSCSYMGLNRDKRLAEAAIDAVSRYGTSHSSSVTYTYLGLYTELEKRFQSIFGARVEIAPTTTLGHLAALPVLVLPDDVALIDHQAHASMQLATDVLRGRGTTVEIIPHSNVKTLEAAVQRHASANRVWYIADGIYSMYGDVAPVEHIHPLLDKYPNLHLYYDDAHGIGWQGHHGCGEVLSRVPWHERMVVIGGLAKSFGATGAVLAFGDPELADLVHYCGQTLLFSGPIQPAALGAAVASADFHLSAEHAVRQAELKRRIALAHSLLLENDLTLEGHDSTPVWYVRVGGVSASFQMVRDLLDDGYYVNPAVYPAVPRGHGGIRFTLTLNQTEDQLRSLVEAISRRIPETARSDIVIDLRTSSTSHIRSREDSPQLETPTT
jgi:7-keto-8-aminopelargonate synthetase-like enzyme